MEPADNQLYAVILKDESQLQWGPIAQALAVYRQVPPLDTTAEAKRCWGILAEKDDKATAEKFCEAMNSRKLSCSVVPQTALLPHNPPILFSKISQTPESLSLGDHANFSFSLPWISISVLAAAAFQSSQVRVLEEKQGSTGAQKLLSAGIMLTTGLPIRIGPKGKTVQKNISETQLSFVLDLHVKNSQKRYRMMADQFDFSFLHEKMVHGAMGNFRLLLQEWSQRAPQARQSRGTRILLGGHPITTMGYETLFDLEKETRWLNAIAPQ
ncbi:MAG: hypothetical protein KCHDKBKB_01848 [Elusimicrobia bacterium]|nr:hypothetical protein [Elusimicrobiota bacterium]